MNTYIFLTNQYMPKPGATGVCVHQLAKHLASEGNDVFTVCYEGNEPMGCCDGVKIVRVSPPVYLQEKRNTSPITAKLQHMESLASKLLHITAYPLRSRALVHRYEKTVEALMKDRDNVKIIASYTPLEAVIAAAQVKKKYGDAVKAVYYSTDTLSNEQGEDGILPASYRQECGIRWEKKLFSVCDQILIMECHKEHYFSGTFKPYWEKMRVVNFPLLVKTTRDECKVKEHSGKTRLVYAGTLYRKLRNPSFLLSILTALSSELDFEALFLGSGDCEDILEKAEIDSRNAIKFLGMQPHEAALEYIDSADILLSIGNAESPMAPSKIFEYMATGKPIVHTYTYEKDPCLEPLRKYGNALIIKEDDKFDISQLQAFVASPKVVDFQTVAKIFQSSTPEYTTSLIEGL